MLRKSACVFILFLFLARFAFPAQAINFNADTVFKSVVVIYSGNSVGSGFALGPSKIITNAHVIENTHESYALTYNDSKVYNLKLLAIDKAADLAVLQISGKKLPALTIGDVAKLSTGVDLYVVGAPENLQYSITKGILSAKERLVGRYSYIQTDAPVNSGNSGGPLLNESGEVIGVNTLKITDAEGIGLAIPMSTVSKFLLDSDIDITQQAAIISDLAKGAVSVTDNAGRVQSDKSADNSDIVLLRNENAVLTVLLAFCLLIIAALLLILILRRKRKSKPKKELDFDIEILQ